MSNLTWSGGTAARSLMDAAAEKLDDAHEEWMIQRMFRFQQETDP
jgi:hypothetical protein